jgi:hypothetical protein
MAPTQVTAAPRYTVTPAERRTSLRFRSNLRVSCQPDQSGGEPGCVSARSRIECHQTASGWSSQGKDISTHGVALVCSRRLDPGTVLECQFLNPITRFTCSRPVQVMRITPQADDKWLAGCRFAQELEFSELLGLL